MLCEICGKNEATIHIEEITDGKSKTLHLCGECMAKNPSLGGVDINAFNLGDIICNWAGGVNKKHSDNGDNNSESSDNKKTVICVVGLRKNYIKPGGWGVLNVIAIFMICLLQH